MEHRTGQEETKNASRPATTSDEQRAEAWGPVRVGELIGGKYRITRLLAKGGMGVVYEAQHVVVRRRFAVKFLRPDFVGDRDSLARFQREAVAAGMLENEHIASAFDFGITANGSPYLVMEYLVGESLAPLLKRETRLPCERAADLCAQACHGAEAAHAAGIVHRDLKPHNLFICRREDGTDLLKILDFGIAKLELIKHDQASTQTGAILGTPAYMSPEQARGEKTVDSRADVYSLGAILYEMLSGRLPHPTDSPHATLYHISTQPALPLAGAVPELPAPLLELVNGALSTDPSGRPQSAKAFALELGRFAKRQTWPEPPNHEAAASLPAVESHGSDEASAAEPPISTTDRVFAEAARQRGRRLGIPALVALLTVVLAVVGALAVALGNRLLKTAPSAGGAPPSIALPAQAVVPEKPKPATQAEKVGLVPTLPSNPSTSTRPEATVDGAIKALVGKTPSGGKRRRTDLPVVPPIAPSVENAPRPQPPRPPVQVEPAASGRFPQASFDPKNPYANP